MKLRKVRITGFQSFADSGDIEFADGINLIIGQNNGGKSAVLRALQTPLVDSRHRTPERWAEYELPAPQVAMKIAISGEELRRGILRIGSQQRFPVPEQFAPEAFIDAMWAKDNLELDLVHVAGQNVRAPNYPSHGLFVRGPNQSQLATIISPHNGSILVQSLQHTADDTLPDMLNSLWARDMFSFTAERMSIGESGHAFAERLTPSANNLPAVLHTLSGNRGDLFARLVRHLREIFSTVGNLSVTPTQNNNIEIRVWPTHAMERVELSFPLNSSGTGVSQVIAILTAIITAENAVIIIDEINSFLHPAAVKALLRILQTEYAHHQYIISTHAPEVIGFSNPKTIHLVKRDGYDSTIERLDLSEVGKFRDVAEHLGVSMADVFAAERVIWVEGPTEELSFPYLYQKLNGEPVPRGTVFTSVTATGDFNRKRDRALVYEVYSRLSSAAATLVVAVIFSFDAEELSDDEKESMVRDSGQRLKFLPRRHIECYLLDPIAVAAMIVAKDPQSVETATPEAVSDLLKELATDRSFTIAEWQGDLADQAWLSKVDAANLISQVTRRLSEERATFNKKEDSLSLLQDILLRTPDQLQPLYDYVRNLVGAVTAA